MSWGRSNGPSHNRRPRCDQGRLASCFGQFLRLGGLHRGVYMSKHAVKALADALWYELHPRVSVTTWHLVRGLRNQRYRSRRRGRRASATRLLDGAVHRSERHASGESHRGRRQTNVTTFGHFIVGVNDARWLLLKSFELKLTSRELFKRAAGSSLGFRHDY